MTLVGYSVAGNEETEFAGRYPERVAKLVYLDAAYDLVENAAIARRLDLPLLSGLDKATLELHAGDDGVTSIPAQVALINPVCQGG